MRTWLAIFLFSGLTFLALGIRPFISDKFLALILGNAHYIYLLVLIYINKIKVSPLLEILLYFILIGHFTLDFFFFFKTRLLDDFLTISINLVYLALCYLGFVMLFKKLGSAFYTGKKSDWLAGFPVGLISFLFMLLMFMGRVQPKFDAILILLSIFFSLFYTLGVNTPLKTKNYFIMLLALILNFATLFIAIYVFQVEPFRTGEILMKGLFVISYYCILEASFQISQPLINFKSQH